MKEIEINGMVLEFDEKMLLKQEIRVGDNVQVLVKEYNSYRCYPGVVINLLPFENAPAMEVMYVENNFSSFELQKKVIVHQEGAADQEDKNIKILKMNDTFLPFTKERAIDVMERDIAKKQHELDESKLKLEYFLKYFNTYFINNTCS